MSIVTSAVEVGLVCILQVVLDVAHLVVHCDEVLLVHPEQNGGCVIPHKHCFKDFLTLPSDLPSDLLKLSFKEFLLFPFASNLSGY